MGSEIDGEIQELTEKYRRLEKIVDERMHRILLEDGNSFITVTHRIKTADSIKRKLKKKQDNYSDVREIRDILGFRVICYFIDDVDIAAEKIAEHFRVDWNRSKDKRKLIDARSFGYLSLHYICALPESEDELSSLWFEIQIKTMLQHTWAEIEHDLGYKTEIEVPRDVRRSFSRAASLLETADYIFSEIRNRLKKYESEVKSNIESESLENMTFDAITLKEFTAHNKTYLKLLEEIAAITDAHIAEGNPAGQLALIEFLGINTLKEMTELIDKRRELTLQLARRSLQGSELDELSSTVVYHYLFRAELIAGDHSRERVRDFFMLASKNDKTADKNTEKIMNLREELMTGQ